VGGDVPVNSEALLVTDFINLKIKPAQSFGRAHKGKVCVRVFIGVSARTCMSICVCTVFLKKIELAGDNILETEGVHSKDDQVTQHNVQN
jgi:hypothetical protein